MSQVITITGGDLFHLAAQYLGDATQWIRIAQANGLSDPFLVPVGQVLLDDSGAVAVDGLGNVILSDPIRLVIPDINPNAGGGAPPQ